MYQDFCCFEVDINWKTETVSRSSLHDTGWSFSMFIKFLNEYRAFTGKETPSSPYLDFPVCRPVVVKSSRSTRTFLLKLVIFREQHSVSTSEVFGVISFGALHHCSSGRSEVIRTAGNQLVTSPSDNGAVWNFKGGLFILCFTKKAPTVDITRPLNHQAKPDKDLAT